MMRRRRRRRRMMMMKAMRRMMKDKWRNTLLQRLYLRWKKKHILPSESREGKNYMKESLGQFFFPVGTDLRDGPNDFCKWWQLCCFVSCGLNAPCLRCLLSYTMFWFCFLFFVLFFSFDETTCLISTSCNWHRNLWYIPWARKVCLFLIRVEV